MGTVSEQPSRRPEESGHLVRSQDHLAVWSSEATGHRLTLVEAIDSYGEALVQQVFEEGIVPLIEDRREPAYTLRHRRESLGFSTSDVAQATGLPVATVEQCEDSSRRNSIHSIERIAVVLGLDERLVGKVPGANGDERLAIRLKSYERAQMSARSAAILAECAWIASVQVRLAFRLGDEARIIWDQPPSSDYGGSWSPPYRKGYQLARRTRDVLGLSPDEPISSMKDLLGRINVPFLFGEIDTRIAGATLETGQVRAIVVNLKGNGNNPWVMRATVAHELGHLLWDPSQSLKGLRVDTRDEIERNYASHPDHVEARANAFAIEFLAPSDAVREVYTGYNEPRDGVEAVCQRFGISVTAARFHIGNTLGVSVLPASAAKDVVPSDDWLGRERYTLDWFPLATTPLYRRGRFCSLVARAEKEQLISTQTATSYLVASEGEYVENREFIRDLFH